MSVEQVIAATVECGSGHEIHRLRVRYAVDPGTSANRGIVDLDRATQDADGRVRFVGDIWVRLPAEGGPDRRRLLVVAANRGRAGSAPFGDRFLAGRGWTIAWVGWQWDIEPGPGLVGITAPDPLDETGNPIVSQVRVEILSDTWIADRVLSDPTGRFTPLAAADVDEPDAVLTERTWPGGVRRTIPRSRWRFARDDRGQPVPDDSYLWLEGGFRPHRYYEVVYTTKVCPVGGAGILAFRDAGAFLRHGTALDGNPAAGRVDHVVAYGASQSGRFIRSWLFEGRNLDENGRLVYDGVQADVAGGRRGECNQRCAQPALMYPAGFGCLPPFATADPHGAGLLDRQHRVGGVPKVVLTNAAWEYWLGDAALTHIDPAGERDLADADNVRNWFFAGVDHYGHMPDLKNELPVANPPNRTDGTLLRRAAFANLEGWVVEGTEPPPSRVPSLAERTAIPRRAVLAAMRRIPGVILPDDDALPALWQVDLGSESDTGVARWPAKLGAAWPDLVSAIDEDGNETAGIRLPEIAVPVATHTGWNPRIAPDDLPATLYPRCGWWLPFPPTEAERVLTDDPRPSIAARYRDRDDYEHRARAAAARLVESRHLLADDIEAAVQAALATYDAAVSAAALSTTGPESRSDAP